MNSANPLGFWPEGGQLGSVAGSPGRSALERPLRPAAKEQVCSNGDSRQERGWAKTAAAGGGATLRTKRKRRSCLFHHRFAEFARGLPGSRRSRSAALRTAAGR